MNNSVDLDLQCSNTEAGLKVLPICVDSDKSEQKDKLIYSKLLRMPTCNFTNGEATVIQI